VGAVIVSYGLSFGQSLIAMLGIFSYLLIGYFGINGARTGRPTMALSQFSFGTVGNVFPSIVSWLNLVGWETIVLVLASYIVETILHQLFGLRMGAGTTLLALALVTFAAFSVALLGYATLVKIQTFISYVFGALTAIVFVLLVPHIHWAQILAVKSGSWLKGVLPATSIVIAAGGLSWVNGAADYTRYLPPQESGKKIVGATMLGAFIPGAALLVFGILLAFSMPTLATASNPIVLLKDALPGWMAIPYLLTAVAGMVAGDIMDVYSSGLSLLAARIKLPRSRTVFFDAILSISGSLYVLLVAKNFVNTFESLLTILAGFLTPWAAVFLVDTMRHLRYGYPQTVPAVRWSAWIAWIVGIAASLLFTSTSIFSGPFATGIFNGSSLGFLLGFL
ncbi:MAG: cytosine permease, partial [Firmicutes bacterium]|nr:cytosine permease [Bacillota bacterium]